MPLLISNSGAVTYIRSKQVLSEILGHSNFDGFNWAVDDRIIFEDGTESRITREPEEQFFTCSDSTPADLEEVKLAVGAEFAANWQQLFAGFEDRSKSTRGRKFTTILVVSLFIAVGLVAAAIVIHRVLDPFDHQPFSSSAWAGAEPEARAAMARDVVRRIRAGMTETQVVAMLGKPDEVLLPQAGNRVLGTRTYTYDLGNWSMHGKDAAFIYVHLDAADHVIQSEIYGY